MLELAAARVVEEGEGRAALELAGAQGRRGEDTAPPWLPPRHGRGCAMASPPRTGLCHSRCGSGRRPDPAGPRVEEGGDEHGRGGG